MGKSAYNTSFFIPIRLTFINFKYLQLPRFFIIFDVGYQGATSKYNQPIIFSVSVNYMLNS